MSIIGEFFRPSDEPWMRHALCRKRDPEDYFPSDGENTKQYARKVCAGCPVKGPCLGYALENDIAHGVWGGLSIKERNRIRRDHNAPVFRPECGTKKGVDQHYRYGEPACRECLDARADHERERRARRGVA